MKANVGISSPEMLLLWNALRERLARTPDPVEDKELRELLDKLGCKSHEIVYDTVDEKSVRG